MSDKVLRAAKHRERYLALRSLTAAVGEMRKAIGAGREWRNAIYMNIVRAHTKARAALCRDENTK